VQTQEVFIPTFLQGRRKAILVCAFGLIAAIAVQDWYFRVEDISFGVLYLFPMLMLGSCMSRWQLATVAALCTALTEAFDPFKWTWGLGVSRMAMALAAFYGAGVYGFETARNRRLTAERLEESQREADFRRAAEEQLKFLISSSPATIFTLDATGKVLLANHAAHRLLGLSEGDLEGKSIVQYLPSISSVLPPPETSNRLSDPRIKAVDSQVTEGAFFRTAMECRGRRQNGEVFLAQMLFSTYRTDSGLRLAAVVFDSSEELRDRAEFSMRQLLTGSKLVMGALCHEIRNICGAIGVVHAKMLRDGRLSDDEDFGTLGTLVQGLENMAGLELRQAAPAANASTDLRVVLEELRIIIEPSFEEDGFAIRWEIPEALPRVWADRTMLLQAFLNVARNSERAMLEGAAAEEEDEAESACDKNASPHELIVRASLENDTVVVRFIDNGPGVAHPDQLFKPFQPGAQASGLGLYLSRTFLRSFRGDIEYESRPSGCSFAILLDLAPRHTVTEEKT
jgi:two-component system, LuxR family, sensor kinase FixL